MMMRMVMMMMMRWTPVKSSFYGPINFQPHGLLQGSRLEMVTVIDSLGKVARSCTSSGGNDHFEGSGGQIVVSGCSADGTREATPSPISSSRI
ncbi:hypothetical protein PoB_003129300 [Plakobranchus ocellatus]|uniref:Secreted protein n=1 Tax=Plakobranchus ocellatus TaxID=259542 RepID=A0AAV4ADD9_9GAST|nr:hypothetical protein PoB_003129300 [Plakobranchus ocellatus]